MISRITNCGFCVVWCVLFIGCGPNETELEKWANLQKKKLPVKVDDNTNFVDCQAGDNEVIYIYEVHGMSDSEFELLAESIRFSVLGNIEINRTELTDLIENKIRMTYVYRNRSGKELLRFTVTPGSDQ